MENVEIIKEHSRKVCEADTKQYLVNVDTKRVLSPMVDVIFYDETGDFFLIEDSITDTINLYFFLDYDGNVIGTGFTNIDNEMLWVKISSQEDTYPFETYERYKDELKEKYAVNFAKNVHENLDASLKMVAHDKRLRKTI